MNTKLDTIFDYLKTRIGEEVTVEEIMEELKDKCQPTDRLHTMQFTKRLMGRVPEQGYILKRTSKLGRGAKAVYMMVRIEGQIS